MKTLFSGRRGEMGMIMKIVLWVVLIILVVVIVQKYVVQSGDGVLGVFDGLPGLGSK